jgi:hypothetical protein
LGFWVFLVFFQGFWVFLNPCILGISKYVKCMYVCMYVSSQCIAIWEIIYFLKSLIASTSIDIFIIEQRYRTSIKALIAKCFFFFF